MSASPSSPSGLAFGELGQRLRRIGAGIEAAFRRIPIDEILQVSTVALTELNKHYQQRILRAFTEADLWIAPSMPRALVLTLTDLLAAGDRRAADLTLWNHYARTDHARLAGALARWWDDPEFRNRQHIIEQAFAAHQRKLYAASIPTLLAQVEGICGHIIHTTEKIPTSVKMRLGSTTKLIKQLLEITSEDGKEDIFLDVLRYVGFHAGEQYITGVAYEEMGFTAEYERLRKRAALNRHAILHGIQIGYPSALNSLRCFLLLDYLQALCRKLEQEAPSSS